MINDNDSLARTAHAFGMTDLEFEERSRVEAEVAAQQVIRKWQEDEEADRQALKKFSENEDIDWGFHDQHDFWPKSLIIKGLRHRPPGVCAISRW